MNYQAIIHGALGLGWWAYPFIDRGYWDEYATLIQEIRTLEPVLLNGQKGKLTVDQSGIHSLTKTQDGMTYILAANVSGKDVQATFTGAGKTAELIFESRSLPITDNKFTDTFKPLAVHVYRLK